MDSVILQTVAANFRNPSGRQNNLIDISMEPRKDFRSSLVEFSDETIRCIEGITRIYIYLGLRG